jgi:hypothetical protein
MTTAIFGLIGVVVGGLLTGAVNLGTEWVRERRETRAAARILALELVDDHMKVLAALGTGGWLPLSRLKFDQWEALGPVLARKMGPRDWAALQSAYVSLGSLLKHVEYGQAPSSSELVPPVRRNAEMSQRAIDRAATALARYTHVKSAMSPEEEERELREFFPGSSSSS